MFRELHNYESSIWEHDHNWGTGNTANERRTLYVILLTLVMMVFEIAAGTLYGSMALVADGWHMATHALALGIALFAYWFARRHATNPRYTFGTGKMNALGGFASAIVLGLVAFSIGAESLERLLDRVSIRFDEALFVAALGLVVNLTCAFIMRHDENPHGHCGHTHAGHDHNYRAAYVHILTDALTSVLAIIALVTGKFFGWTWMDPAVGILGAAVILIWAADILRDTAAVLLDASMVGTTGASIKTRIEAGQNATVSDLHTWSIGYGKTVAVLSIVTSDPKPPAYYKNLLAGIPELAHVSIEINKCECISCSSSCD